MDYKQRLHPVHGQLVISQWLDGCLNRNNECLLRSVQVRKLAPTHLIGGEFFAEILIRRDRFGRHV